MKGLFSLHTFITRVFPLLLVAFGLGPIVAAAESGEFAPNEFAPTDEPFTLQGDSAELWASFFK